MDPLSLSASIAGLCTITEAIVTYSYKYAKEAKGARNEIKSLLDEMNELFGILSRLRLIAQRYQDEGFEPTMRLEYINSCYALLQRIDTGLRKASPKKDDMYISSLRQKAFSIGKSMEWPFTSPQTKALVADLAKHKSTMNLALAADGMSSFVAALNQGKAQVRALEAIQSTLLFQQMERKQYTMNEERREMLEAIGPYDPFPHQKTAEGLRQPGTGLWFTEGPDFQYWLSTKNANLWLYGIPGAGKTILAGSAISSAIEKVSPNSGVGFFYCDYKDPRTQDAMVILGSLIRQLALQNEESLDKVEKFYQAQSSKSRSASRLLTPTPDSYCTLLKNMSDCFEDLLIIVDALDECSIKRSDLVINLASLSTDSTIKTLFTSRREPDIERNLGHFRKVPIAAMSQDLQLYVASEIHSRSRENELLTINPEITQEIMDRLTKEADGMFRWVACQMDHICELPTITDIRKALYSLPKTLFETYERILDRVNKSNPANQRLVQRILTWIVCARKPLTTEALLHAISISEGDKKLDQFGIPTMQMVLRWCSSLVRRTAGGDGLELAHFTVEEFLLDVDSSTNTEFSCYKISPELQNVELAKLCLTYLEFEDVRSFSCYDTQSFTQRLANFPLLEYASDNWIEHARGHLNDEGLLLLIKTLMDPSKNAAFICWIQCHYAYPHEYGLNMAFLGDTSTLHFAASLHLPKVCSWLLYEKNCVSDLDRCSSIGTPLYCALTGNISTRYIVMDNWPVTVAKEREETIACLLNAGAKVNKNIIHPKSDQTILSLAVSGRQKAVWKILLEAGALVDEHCLSASVNWDKQALRVFLNMVKEKNLTKDIESRYIGLAIKGHGKGTTGTSHVLAMASSFQTKNTMKDISSYTSTIIDAACHGHFDLASKLIQKQGVEIDVPGVPKDSSGNALHSAVAHGHLDIVKLLVKNGASVNKPMVDGRTPFLLAIEYGQLGIAEYLQSKGADINAMTTDGDTALHLSAKARSIGAIQYTLQLPEFRHRLSTTNNAGQTPLYSAILRGDAVHISRYLLEVSDGPALLVRAADGSTCLHAAVYSANSDNVALLSGTVLSPYERDYDGYTPIHTAADIGTERCLITLLKLTDGLAVQADQYTDHFSWSMIGPKPQPLQRPDSTWAFERISIINSQTKTAKTPFMLAISRHYIDWNMLHFIVLHKEFNGSLRDSNGRIPLVAVAYTFRYNTYNLPPRATEVFLQVTRVSDVNSTDSSGSTALHYLCTDLRNEALDAIRILLTGPSKASIRLDIVNHAHWTPLHLFFCCMAKKGNDLRRLMEIAMSMLEITSRSEFERPGGDGSRVLNLAIRIGNVSIISKLLDMGANIEARDLTKDRRSALETLCMYGARSSSVVHQIIKLSQSISRKDVAGLPPLHLACKNVQQEVIKQLLDAGAPIGQKAVNGYTPLHVAVLEGHVLVVELLCQRGASVKSPGPGLWWNEYLINIVQDAETCAILHRQEVHWLERCQCRFETTFIPYISTTSKGKFEDKFCSVLFNDLTALHMAAFNNNIEVIDFILNHVQNLDIDTEAAHGVTPLLFAVILNNQKAAKALLEANADAKVNAFYHPNNWTALHFAAHLGSTSIVDDLLKKGSNPNFLNIEGQTPSLIAKLRGYEDIAKILEEAESISLSYTESLCASRFEPSMSKDAELGGPLRTTHDTPISGAMVHAVDSGDLQMCQQLVSRGYTINGRSISLDTHTCTCSLLIKACWHQHWHVAKYLLDVGASFEGGTCGTHTELFQGYELLHIVALYGNAIFLQLILEKTSSRSLQTLQPLHIAAYQNHHECVRVFLQSEKDCRPMLEAKYLSRKNDGFRGTARLVSWSTETLTWEEVSGYGENALHIAARAGHTETIDILLVMGAVIGCLDENNDTPLHDAVRSGSGKAVQTLLEAGANPNAHNIDGKTPMFMAKEETIFYLLMGYGANPKAKNYKRQTALFSTIQNGHVTLAKEMVLWGMDPLELDVYQNCPLTESIQGDSCWDGFTLENLPVKDKLQSPIFGSLLNIACYSGKTTIVKSLLAKCPEEDRQGYVNNICIKGTSLYMASVCNYEQIMESLIEYGADVNLASGSLGSPLIGACQFGRLNAARCLLRNGAKVFWEKPDGIRITAKEAGKSFDDIQRLLQNFEQRGLEGLDEEIPGIDSTYITRLRENRRRHSSSEEGNTYESVVGPRAKDDHNYSDYETKIKAANSI